MSEPSEDRVLGAYAHDTEIDGRPFVVFVHWARVDGKAVPVGLDLRCYIDYDPGDGKRHVGPIHGQWTEITSPLIRKVRVAEEIEKSRQLAPEKLTKWNDDAVTAAQRKALADTAEAFAQPKRPKRGPAPLWTDEVITSVVAPTYLNAGPRPVDAVRRALEEHAGQRVTKEQARKAVARARARGVLPAADRAGKR